MRGRVGQGKAFRTSLAPTSFHQLSPQVLWTQERASRIFNTFSFLPQHRFLPCENKSKAVEQVKSAFSKVSLHGGREGLGNRTCDYSPRGRGWQMLSCPHPSLRETVGTRQMV